MPNTNGGQEDVSPATIQKNLRGIKYPASKNDLVHRAEENQAPKAVMDKIRQIPGDQFGSPAEVMKAFGQAK